MPQITYIQPDGERQSVAVSPGDSVMLTAVSNGIDGIVAECGGSMMCATCHVYIDEASVGAVGPIGEVEAETLEGVTSERRLTSRLGCQVKMPENLEELIVHLPASQ